MSSTTLSPSPSDMNGDSSKGHSSKGQASPAGMRLHRRQRQLPVVGLGIIMVLGGALAFGVWATSLGDRVPVLVAAHDLVPGRPIELADLRIAEVASSGDIGVIASDQRHLLVGDVVQAPVPAGTVLSPGLFAESIEVADGFTLVGAVLGPGEVPVAHMRTNDQVLALRTSTADATGQREVETLGRATIFNIDGVAADIEERQFVTLLVADDLAAEVADAAATELLRLVMVPAADGDPMVGGVR